MTPMTLYEILGVPRDATAAQVKKAYRKAARKHHPDANPGDPEAEARFKELSCAYEVLSDPVRRARYDQTGDTKAPPSPDAELASVLVPVLDWAIGETAGWGGDPSQTDLVAKMRGRIQDGIRDGERQIGQLEKTLKTFKKVQGRFAVPEGQVNLFEEQIADRVRHVEGQIAVGKAELDKLTRAKNYLAGVTYTTDKKPGAKGKPSIEVLWQLG